MARPTQHYKRRVYDLDTKTWRVECSCRTKDCDK